MPAFPGESLLLFAKVMVSHCWLKRRPLWLFSGETGMKWSHFTVWVNKICVNHLVYWARSSNPFAVKKKERVSSGAGILRSSGQCGLYEGVVRYWLQNLCFAAIESRLPRGALLEQLKNLRLWNKNSLLPIILHSHCQTAEKIDCSHFFSGLCETCRWYSGACLQKDKHHFVAIWLITLAKTYKGWQKRITKGSSGTMMCSHVTRWSQSGGESHADASDWNYQEG